MASKIEASSRILGCLVGLAVGDALGTTVEVMPPGSFPPVEDMIGGGKFRLEPGQWTDDTSMMLCLAESLIECQGFNPLDQRERYCRWYQDGHLSSTGECFDIGKTVITAITNRSKDPFPGSTAPRAAGNGCLMRLAPVPLCYRHVPEIALELSAQSARVTHGPVEATDACKYFAGLLIGCLQGASKEELLSKMYCPVANYWTTHSMAPKVKKIACGSYKAKSPPDIKATGYIIDSLEAVLWAFYNSSNFREGCLKAVNLGDDADTVGAIYGQLAGAYYGLDEIPIEWRDKISFVSLIELFGEELEGLKDKLSLDVTETDFPPLVDHTKLSEKYQNIKLQFYDQLETMSHDTVYRRSQPCPKTYHSMEEFDQDIGKMAQFFLERLVSEKHQTDQETLTKIIKDFERLWDIYRKNLKQKIERRLLRQQL